MKFLLLFLSLFFVLEFHQCEESIASDNALSQQIQSEFLVLNLFKAGRSHHGTVRNRIINQLSFLGPMAIPPKISKPESYFVSYYFSWLLFQWGPQSLATPPPFSSHLV